MGVTNESHEFLEWENQLNRLHGPVVLRGSTQTAHSFSSASFPYPRPEQPSIQQDFVNQEKRRRFDSAKSSFVIPSGGRLVRAPNAAKPSHPPETWCLCTPKDAKRPVRPCGDRNDP